MADLEIRVVRVSGLAIVAVSIGAGTGISLLDTAAGLLLLIVGSLVGLIITWLELS